MGQGCVTAATSWARADCVRPDGAVRGATSTGAAADRNATDRWRRRSVWRRSMAGPKLPRRRSRPQAFEHHLHTGAVEPLADLHELPCSGFTTRYQRAADPLPFWSISG